jgi:hypothetical protein
VKSVNSYTDSGPTIRRIQSTPNQAVRVPLAKPHDNEGCRKERVGEGLRGMRGGKGRCEIKTAVCMERMEVKSRRGMHGVKGKCAIFTKKSAA